MGEVINPEELPKWVPGHLLETSDGLGWSGTQLRAYHYQPLEVSVPPLSHFVIVAYQRGATEINRRVEGRWTNTYCQPGDLSLLTRSQRSQWRWTNAVEVRHVYLSEALVSKVATDLLERPAADVKLLDVLKVRDPDVTALVDKIAKETTKGAVGGTLYVEALSIQLAAYLLKRYAAVNYRCGEQSARFSSAQQRHIIDFVDSNLHESLSLQTLANELGMGVWTFIRRFRGTFSEPPHAYIISRRIARAQDLICHGAMPLKEIALACGFSDQAHLTRVVRKHLKLTPGSLRKAQL